jgi:HTH-type transcriptional regulator / antitoxin HigA
MATVELPIKYACRQRAPKVITSKAQHDAYVSLLVHLQKEKKEPELARLFVLVIKDYESREYPFEAASPVEVLKELMAANNLQQKDLAPIFGGGSVVSLVLSGQRPLNKQHIEKLSQRFHVSPAVFF